MLKNVMHLSMEEAKTKLVMEALPMMANVYDLIEHKTLAEARQLLTAQIGDDWVEKTLAIVGLERLKEIRPSWYQTFVAGENGLIGRDEMSELVAKYMTREHALMEIAFYYALNHTGLYTYYLNIPLDYDAVDFTVTTGEGEERHVMDVEQGSIPGYEWFSKDRGDVTAGDYFKMIGHTREMFIRLGREIRQALKDGTLEE
ncbi:hypothetical protein CBW65_09140 [Tumebacillus avium]|uniref:Uncharacterized protein n=1 Tax=Tumebacillus avium TaxID=1903704 RepID=A0A1Y0ILM1_9BACL|nr:hypothetical protein [Tumebacillus avium]ARU61180.1 hypothetical protein CBW65_09140 [Tumebacillus avium]